LPFVDRSRNLSVIDELLLSFLAPMNKKNQHCRKSIRMKDYDYSQPGEYFITICTHKHECTLGSIINGGMQLNNIGNTAEKCWREIPKHFSNVKLDEYVILLHALRVAVTGLRLPNHIHGILILQDHGRDVQLNVPTRLSPQRWTLSVIIRTFKAAVTTICHRNEFYQFRWQPRFYEHIIRSEKELNNIRDYITNNIIQWSFDTENPRNISLL
jgi:putative transposase